MGFFSNIFKNNPISSLFGGGGGGGGLFGGGNPLSGIFGGGGGGLDFGKIGNFGSSGNVSPGVSAGGGVVQQRTGATGTPVYPTANGNASSAYPLAILGSLTGSEAVYGRKPDYPLAPTPDEILRANIYANTQNQPGAQKFAAGTNAFNLEQLNKLYGETTPGLDTARSQALANISDRLAGKLPQSDIDAIKRKGAEWGLTSGTGSPAAGTMAGNYTLRDLGLTTYAEQNRANKDLEDFIASTRRDILPPLSDPTQFTLKPSYNPYAEDARLIDIAKVLAAPVPSAAGAAAAQQALLEALLSVYSGSPKSGSTNPQNYYPNWQTGNTGGYSQNPNPGGGSSSYLPDFYSQGPQ